VQHVKEWEAKSATIEDELNEILAVHGFYSANAEPFKGTRQLYMTLQSIRPKVPKGNVIHHFLDNYATADKDATIHKKDVWQVIQDNKASVLTEEEALKRTWRQLAKDSLGPLKTLLKRQSDRASDCGRNRSF